MQARQDRKDCWRDDSPTSFTSSPSHCYACLLGASWKHKGFAGSGIRASARPGTPSRLKQQKLVQRVLFGTVHICARTGSADDARNQRTWSNRLAKRPGQCVVVIEEEVAEAARFRTLLFLEATSGRQWYSLNVSAVMVQLKIRELWASMQPIVLIHCRDTELRHVDRWCVIAILFLVSVACCFVGVVTGYIVGVSGRIVAAVVAACAVVIALVVSVAEVHRTGIAASTRMAHPTGRTATRMAVLLGRKAVG